MSEKKLTPADHLEIACGRLLTKYPLYSYRSGAPEEWKLSILMVGGGEKLCTLLGQLLANSQLLDTGVEVTIVSPAVRETLAELEDRVPGLRRFLRIRAEGADSEVEWCLGTLRFLEAAWCPETMTALMQQGENWRYVVVCTEDDDQSSTLAQTCGIDPARVTVHTRGGGLEVCSPEAEIMSGEEDSQEEEWMNRIAYNLHYVYQKFTKPRASRQSIEDEFGKDYNYSATRQNVLHIRSKLACCGMENAELNGETAAQFAAILKKQPEIADRLADLEHKRWVVEKTFRPSRETGKGYWLQEDLDQIYQNDADSTHSEEDGWHVCLVPSSPGSRLTFEDWRSDGCRPELDDLNTVSLRVHRICWDIADENRDEIDKDLESLEKRVGDKMKLSTDERKMALEYVQGMAAAVSQMYQKKRIAYSRFSKNKDKLEELLKGKKDKKKAMDLIDNISRLLLPLAEYVVDKEHKDQDYLFVEKIPFALTHRKHSVLLKLLGEKGDDQFAPWQMEPTDVIYTGFADTAEELDDICAQARRIHRFLGHSCNELRAHYHLFVLEDTPGIVDACVHISEGVAALVHKVRSRNPAEVFGAMDEVLQGQQVDYVDVTGGSPVMISVAERFAEKHKLGLFYVQDGQIRNICRAETLEYPAPRKGISVREMFEQSGAVLIGSEGSKTTNLSKVYERFWEISRSASNWDAFCKFISVSYKNQKCVNSYSFGAADTANELVETSTQMPAKILADILPAIRELESGRRIMDVKITAGIGCLWDIRFKIHGKRSAEKMIAALKKLQREYNMNLCYEANLDENRIIGKELAVKGAEPAQEVREEYERLFRELEKESVIYDLTIEEKISFKLSAVEFLSALRNSGKALEYYLYNTALQKGRFDDADMSWLFFHNSDEESAKNELDVICTKGTTSLFISAKDVSLNTIDSKNFLNYVCYEVSLLADRFGINARTVLAAPKVPQFDGREPSRLVKKAWKRGVYLLGDACFADGNLGKVLDNIARGEENWYGFLLPQQ